MLFSFKASSSEQTQEAGFPSLIQPKLNIWRMMGSRKGKKNFFWKYPYKNAGGKSVSSWRSTPKDVIIMTPDPPFLVHLQWMYYRSKIKHSVKVLFSSRFTNVNAPNMCIFWGVEITSHPFMLCISSMCLWRTDIHISMVTLPTKIN